MRKKIKNIRWKVVDSMFLSLFLTGIIVDISNVGASFIDGLVISRALGPDAMAAYGIVHPIYSVVGAFSGLIGVGMQITCSALFGRGQIKDVNRYFSQSVCVGTVLSLLLAVVVLLFSKPFAVLLGASGSASELVQPASQYLFGIGVGIPAMILIPILSPGIQLDGGRKIIRQGAILNATTNILFDLLAVYLKLGLSGIAFGTAISSYLNLFYLCLHFAKKERTLHFVKPNVPILDFLKMLTNGTEKIMVRLTGVICPIVLNLLIISYGGTLAVSALSVQTSISRFLDSILVGITTAVSTLTALYYGETNEEAIMEVKKCAWKYIGIFLSAISLILILFSGPIAHLYVSEEGELYQMVVYGLVILGLYQVFGGIVATRTSYLQAIHRQLNMNLLVITSKLLSKILSAFVLGRIFGVYGILSYLLVSCILSLLVIYIFNQIKYKKLFPSREEFLNLPDRFILSPVDVISLDIRYFKDVSLASEQIQLFCKGHGYNSKIGFYSALAFEEIATKIIKYGFPKNRKKAPIIDLRVVASKDSLIIRIQDNCPYYDITKRINEIYSDNSDPTKNIGIRITGNIAKDISYSYVINTNNIIITYNDSKNKSSAHSSY